MAGPAYGEDEVYYCADNESTGVLKKQGSYQMSRNGFQLIKFKIKFDQANKRIEMADEAMKRQFTCTQPYLNHSIPALACIEAFSMFNFNPDNGRYVFAKGFGYVAGVDDDSVSVSIGKCDKF